MFTLPFHPKNKSPAPPTPHPNGTATHDNGEPPEARAEAAAIVPTTMTLELRPKAPVQAAPTAGAIAPTTMTLELRPKVEDEPEEPAPRNDEEEYEDGQQERPRKTSVANTPSSQRHQPQGSLRARHGADPRRARARRAETAPAPSAASPRGDPGVGPVPGPCALAPAPCAPAPAPCAPVHAALPPWRRGGRPGVSPLAIPPRHQRARCLV
ncbi:hypothetical protein K505DRAFT_324660 [Melanomma pulvis-pyrius CBS 109.77]|uniref:Uncharacterized protein n=1 Tax=Melanomma pulvis-pyrius CBS 109.77 TaxID=1314802 RepID=A0A6A6XFE6_9PLEO|nr:hypothetical protein K505DRAFT_324660 [Melanomma pulvis-pyrius CBS 109.77]